MILVLVKQVHQEITDTKSRARLSDTSQVVFLLPAIFLLKQIQNTTPPEGRETDFHFRDKVRSLRVSSLRRGCLLPPEDPEQPCSCKWILLHHACPT